MGKIGCSQELEDCIGSHGIKSLTGEGCEVVLYGDTGSVLCKVPAFSLESSNGHIHIASPKEAKIVETGKPVSFEILFLNFPEYRIVGSVNSKSQIQMMLNGETLFKDDLFSLDTLVITKHV
jgi:hypothetical protein